MRRVRVDLNRKLLCSGVDLPIEAGTCGRLIAPESSRCIRCHNRRMWLLKYGLDQAEIVVPVLLEAAAAEDDARRDAGAAVHRPDSVPLLDDLPASTRVCGGSGGGTPTWSGVTAAPRREPALGPLGAARGNRLASTPCVQGRRRA
ncbi:MAG: hypothetical protein OXG04_06155 [Acidobacteria bacterium]|nr:hypothetical protein [Acidobacteriota bacterium]